MPKTMANECANLYTHMISVLSIFISLIANLIAIKVDQAVWYLHISENFHQIWRRNKKTSALPMSNEICFPSAFSAYFLVLQTWNRLITLQQASDYAFQVRAQHLKEHTNHRSASKQWILHKYDTGEIGETTFDNKIFSTFYFCSSYSKY